MVPVEEKAVFARDFLYQILEKIGVEANIEIVNSSDQIKLNILGEDLGRIIGRDGEIISAIGFIISIVAFKKFGEKVPLFIDADNYFEKKKQSLEELAFSTAKTVRATGREAILDPMTAQERRIIHIALADDHDVATQSTGPVGNRCVVVFPSIK
jgi:spoIIIJ-associated protein